jgi:uncharacterized protein (TIGR02996 family)
MNEEAAFLRAIQANPSDETAKLVYADWLDERGEHDKAAYLRSVAERRLGPREQFQFNRRFRVWLELVNGQVPVWDTATMFAIGQLRGLLRVYASLNGHESDTGYEFHAQLRPLPGAIDELLALHYGPDCAPVSTEKILDWEAGLRAILTEWLFLDLRQLRNGPGHRLAFLTDRGRDWLIEDVVTHTRGILNPTTSWRVRVTPRGWYAIDWVDLALEAADRVLFLHFSFSD